MSKFLLLTIASCLLITLNSKSFPTITCQPKNQADLSMLQFPENIGGFRMTTLDSIDRSELLDANGASIGRLIVSDDGGEYVQLYVQKSTDGTLRSISFNSSDFNAFLKHPTRSFPGRLATSPETGSLTYTDVICSQPQTLNFLE